jgi:hypothetical protein
LATSFALAVIAATFFVLMYPQVDSRIGVESRRARTELRKLVIERKPTIGKHWRDVNPTVSIIMKYTPLAHAFRLLSQWKEIARL